MSSPKLYATFLLWMLAELFEQLPEVGDPDKPRLVFFFDEAHLLFDDAPKALLDKIEQVVRLIRSKGVGVYFVTQNPLDIPDAVLGQLGNRVQHALRAFTPRDQKAVKAAARDDARRTPRSRSSRRSRELGVGEALVSLLDEQGRPGVTERALIVPPGSRVGPLRRGARAADRGVAARGALRPSVDRDPPTRRSKTRATETAPDEPTRSQARRGARIVGAPQQRRAAWLPTSCSAGAARAAAGSPKG